MKRTREILVGSLSVSLLATAFCLWSALGNGVNICMTAGCALYQDFTLWGISLWWGGVLVFAFLSSLALLGAASAGYAVSGLALLTDLLLLSVMALTAPCISCLAAAFFFAMTYLCFRKAAAVQSGRTEQGRSWLFFIWLLLFTVNLGAVARTQLSVWPITVGGEDVQVRMFFSPSCPSCRQGVESLSGRVDVAFFPLAENDDDVYRIAHMQTLLDTGRSPAEALAAVQETEAPGGLGVLKPGLLWLRFRMLCNKAHVFMAGAQTVPFLEFHGLPSSLSRKDLPRVQKNPPREFPAGLDHTLPLEPLEPLVSGQCGGVKPCTER